jgi:hypothetical protein
MYTEEEATTKWCLQALAGAEVWEKCQASACMAWRFAPQNLQRRWRVERGGKTEIYFWNPSSHQEYADAKVEEIEPDVVPRGYCGLAGTPQ